MRSAAVKVVYDGPRAPAEQTRRLESMLWLYFPPGFGAYARVDVAWTGDAGWLVRRALVALGTHAADVTKSLTASMRAEGLPLSEPGRRPAHQSWLGTSIRPVP